MPRREVRATVAALLCAFSTGHFTAAEAVQRGITQRQLRSAVASGLVRRRRHGYYTIDVSDQSEASSTMEVDQGRGGRRQMSIRTLRCHIEELQRLGRMPVVAGHTAAELWGIPVMGVPEDSSLTVVIEPGRGNRRGRRGGVLLREALLLPSDITVIEGIPITTPLRTAVDVVRLTTRHRNFALMALNGAARAHLDHQLGLGGNPHLITKSASVVSARDDIRETLLGVLHASPKKGSLLVRSLLSWVDPRLETPLESLSWSRMHAGMLPMMTPQVEVKGAGGQTYRVDFWLDGVIGEADGAMKYQARGVLWEEKRRQDDLENAGYSVIRWTWDDMVRTPGLVGSRLRQALARRRHGTPPSDATHIVA